MRSTAVIAALLAAALLAPGCRGKATPEKAAERPPAAVETVAVAPREVVEETEVTGTLSPRIQAEIKSEVSGRVVEVNVLEWSAVGKGQPLARIDTSEAEALLRKARAAVQAAAAGREAARAASATARMGLAEARVAAVRAEREETRARSLGEAGLATRQALDEARTLRDAAAARIDTLQAQVAAAEAQERLAEAQQDIAQQEVGQVEARLAKAVVVAPFDGVVAERLVNVGEVVGEMQKVIFRVVDNRVLDLVVQVPARLSSSVRVGQPLAFAVDAFPGRAFAGTVRHLNPAVSANDRSLRVVAEIPNPGGELRGGVFVKARIETGRRQGVIAVPRAAIADWNAEAGTAALFVAQGGAARRREVRTGAVSGDTVEIAGGLAPGELVVTRGAFLLRDGDAISGGAR